MSGRSRRGPPTSSGWDSEPPWAPGRGRRRAGRGRRAGPSMGTASSWCPPFGVPRTASTSDDRENPTGAKDAYGYRESPAPVKRRLIGPDGAVTRGWRKVGHSGYYRSRLQSGGLRRRWTVPAEAFATNQRRVGMRHVKWVVILLG